MNKAGIASGCKYDMEWRPKCGKPIFDGDYCEEHSKERCPCGKQATGECQYVSMFVCGHPICVYGKCEHNHN